MKTFQSVDYLLFPYEVDDFEEREGDYIYHHLDGELRLIFQDQTVLYFSWINRPMTYSIGWSQKPHFNEGALSPYNMSNSAFWKPFVGQPITFEHFDKTHQVVKLFCSYAELFLSSQYEDGMFSGDCVRVSPTNPDAVSSAEPD